MVADIWPLFPVLISIPPVIIQIARYRDDDGATISSAASWNSKRGEEFIRMINAPYCHVPRREHPLHARARGIDMEEMTTRLVRRVPSRAFISELSQNWIGRANRVVDSAVCREYRVR